MRIILVIAWRNVWRHPVRSAAIIGAIVIGLLGGNFIAALTNGLLEHNFRETVENQVSHIQVHHPRFPGDPEARHRIEDGQRVFTALAGREDVAAASARLSFDGLAAVAGLSAGVRINAVDPEQEARTTGLDQRLDRGEFLAGEGRLPGAVVGRELAAKLNIDTGSRLVLTFQDPAGELVSASFRVEGVYALASAAHEARHLFVRAADMNRLLGTREAVTEIALRLADGSRYRETAAQVGDAFPALKVRTWEELAPSLYFQQRMLGQGQAWVMAIIMAGVAFGVLNTILMSVFERTRELGVLMAVGMKKRRLFTMVIAETVLLAFSGGALGLLLSLLLVGVLGRTGIDLAAVGGENLRGLGFSPQVYPSLGILFYLRVALMVFIFAVFAAVYPAFRAVGVVPAAAVRDE